MKTPIPGLRPVHNRTHSATRAEISVEAGEQLDVTESVARQLVKTGNFAEGEGFTLEPPEDEVTDETDDELVCDVCGFEAKTTGGLASHSRKHD